MASLFIDFGKETKYPLLASFQCPSYNYLLQRTIDRGAIKGVASLWGWNLPSEKWLHFLSILGKKQQLIDSGEISTLLIEQMPTNWGKKQISTLVGSSIWLDWNGEFVWLKTPICQAGLGFLRVELRFFRKGRWPEPFWTFLEGVQKEAIVYEFNFLIPKNPP